VGCVFLGYFLCRTAKKVTCRRATPSQQATFQRRLNQDAINVLRARLTGLLRCARKGCASRDRARHVLRSCDRLTRKADKLYPWPDKKLLETWPWPALSRKFKALPAFRPCPPVCRRFPALPEPLALGDNWRFSSGLPASQRPGPKRRRLTPSCATTEFIHAIEDYHANSH
jgi:hypothetical protein